MSILGRRVSLKLVVGLALVMIMGALLPVMTEEPVREIHIVARGMAFYVDGDFDHPNPTIEVKMGERVRIVMQNEDRGMVHDFALPVAGVATDMLGWRERSELVFETPRTAGTYQYQCNPHQLMMNGVLKVS